LADAFSAKPTYKSEFFATEENIRELHEGWRSRRRLKEVAQVFVVESSPEPGRPVEYAHEFKLDIIR
jgi:hypothetical protein